MEKKGCPVKVLSMDYYFPEIREYIPREDLLKNIEDVVRKEIRKNFPIVIGASVSYTVQYKLALQIVNLVKKIDSNIVTVVGGSHVTFLDERTFLECRSLDVIVRGEGEWTMVDLISSITKKADLGSVAGITLKGNGGISQIGRCKQ